MAEKETSVVRLETKENGKTLTITLEGESVIPFWHHDLKLEAIIQLLQTIEAKDFYEAGESDRLDTYLAQVKEALEELEE